MILHRLQEYLSQNWPPPVDGDNNGKGSKNNPIDLSDTDAPTVSGTPARSSKRSAELSPERTGDAMSSTADRGIMVGDGVEEGVEDEGGGIEVLPHVIQAICDSTGASAELAEYAVRMVRVSFL